MDAHQTGDWMEEKGFPHPINPAQKRLTLSRSVYWIQKVLTPANSSRSPFSHLSPPVPVVLFLTDGSTHEHFFLASDAKRDLQAWVIIYHYSFSVSSALKVNRNASMLSDLLSKIFVPRFRSYDWCLSEFQVYALWKARWLDLQPPTLAPYITLVSDLQRPKMQ